jgi:hypothetical protein
MRSLRLLATIVLCVVALVCAATVIVDILNLSRNRVKVHEQQYVVGLVLTALLGSFAISFAHRYWREWRNG